MGFNSAFKVVNIGDKKSDDHVGCMVAMETVLALLK